MDADLSPEDLEKLSAEGVDMDELVQNITRMALKFVQEQGEKPVRVQLAIFFVFLLIPVSFILYCFCKILNSQRKRIGKDKKKQKEQKRDTKKKV